MAEAKEPYLDGTYYGPPIPPTEPARPTQTPQRRGLGGCTPYKLACTILKSLTTTLIAIGIVILVLWLVYQPDTLKVYVDNAALARFDLAPNHTLYYNLTLNVTIRNPNSKFDIRYERLEADAYYGGSRFGFESFPRFHQDRKSTVAIRPSFQGLAVVPGDPAAVTFDREKREGFFWISVKMYTRVRLKMIVVQSVRYRPEVDCYLRIPAPGNATSAGGFALTQCHVDGFS